MDEPEAGTPHRAVRQLQEFGAVGFAKSAEVEREEAAVIFEYITGQRLICCDPCDVVQMRLESGPKEGPDHEAIEVQRRADHRRAA